MRCCSAALRIRVRVQPLRETKAVADRDEPPFEGGSQPVKQMPPDMPPSRPGAMPVVMGLLIVLILAAGLVFLFSH